VLYEHQEGPSRRGSTTSPLLLFDHAVCLVLFLRRRSASVGQLAPLDDDKASSIEKFPAQAAPQHMPLSRPWALEEVRFHLSVAPGVSSRFAENEEALEQRTLCWLVNCAWEKAEDQLNARPNAPSNQTLAQQLNATRTQDVTKRNSSRSQCF
jgi:hypothetical protein